MHIRKGLSLIETLVVIAIIGVLLGLLLPVIQSTRNRALEVVCRNNLRQLNLAMAQYVETHKRIPHARANGLIGGWTIEILPYLEQQNLRDRIVTGVPIEESPDFLHRQPAIMTCPLSSSADAPPAGKMSSASYVLHPGPRLETFSISDAPVDSRLPWASGPEMALSELIKQVGPHQRGFFHARGFQDGVNFIPGSQ